MVWFSTGIYTKEIGISQSAVFQILQQANLKPHKIVYWRGNPRRQTATYKRNGTVSLIAALAVHSGEVMADTIESNNAVNFLKFLKKLDRKYRNKQLHIIVDNLAVHKHKDVKEWIEGKRKIHLHYTPTYSSWLNQIEIWFSIMTKDVVKGGIWSSSQQLANQLLEYVKTYNDWSYPIICK